MDWSDSQGKGLRDIKEKVANCKVGRLKSLLLLWTANEEHFSHSGQMQYYEADAFALRKMNKNDEWWLLIDGLGG